MKLPRRAPLPLGWALLTGLALLGPRAALAQEADRVERNEWAARVVGRDGAAVTLEAEGPPLDGPREFFYRPSPPFDVNSRWVMVQDSTFGVVFAQASGVKGGIGSYVGDLYLRALTDVRAVEVRALLFNIWGEYEGHLAVTVLVDRGRGEQWEIHPSWSDVTVPLHEHRTSIAWINRVMFDDQSVHQADVATIARAWEHVTGSPFPGLPDDPPLRAVGQ
ncbi:MAG: hypothetical protein AB7T31_12020 [Gemmatimonadales bacterium]